MGDMRFKICDRITGFKIKESRRRNHYTITNDYAEVEIISMYKSDDMCPVCEDQNCGYTHDADVQVVNHKLDKSYIGRVFTISLCYKHFYIINEDYRTPLSKTINTIYEQEKSIYIIDKS